MQILTRSVSLRDRVKAWREAGTRTALVPTLGTLHQGHMSLVAEAQERAEHVVVSIFADAPAHDGGTHEADRELLSKVGAEILFLPPVQELFPFGRDHAAVVSMPDPLAADGAARLTVLTKLLNIMRPEIVIFGERDFAQLVLARRLVEDLFLGVEVVGCPTLRDSDGLAFAGVNRELNPAQRTLAPLLYATLREVAARLDAGERDYAGLARDGAQALDAAGFVTDHFVVRQQADLAAPLAGSRELVIMAAARLGDHCLSDSLPMGLIGALLRRRTGGVFRQRPVHVLAHQRLTVHPRGAAASAASVSAVEVGALPSATAILRSQRFMAEADRWLLPLRSCPANCAVRSSQTARQVSRLHRDAWRTLKSGCAASAARTCSTGHTSWQSSQP